MQRESHRNFATRVTNEQEGCVSALAEAADYIFQLADGVQTPKERRVRAWRKVSDDFTLYRIEEIDRRSDRVKVSADELRILREAAGAGRKETEIERELRETREALRRSREDLEQAKIYIATLDRRFEAVLAGLGSNSARP